MTFLLHLQCAALSLMLLTASAAARSPSSSKATYTKTSFVPPASPTLVSPLKPMKRSAGWPSAVNHPSRVYHQIATGYGTTSLLAKKKKASGGGDDQGPSTKGKIQVMLLAQVPNVGQSGDVVWVSMPVFQNQLQKTKKARKVSEEEVAQMEKEREAEEEETTANAKKTKAMLDEAMFENLGGEDQCDADADICGVALEMKRKAGPEGNLFGGVNPKMVMEALKAKYPKGSWDGKQVKLTDVKDSDGKDVKKKDIKHVGDYSMSVTLGREVDVTFILSILAE